VHVLSALTIKA